MPDVSHYADHRHSRIDSPAERVAALKKAARQRLINDGDRCSIAAVTCVEEAA